MALIRALSGSGSGVTEVAKGKIDLSSITVGQNATVNCGFKPSYIGIGVRQTGLNSGILYLAWCEDEYYFLYIDNGGTYHDSVDTSGFVQVTSTGFTLNRPANTWTLAYYLAVK